MTTTPDPWDGLPVAPAPNPDPHANCDNAWKQVQCDRCGRRYQCTPFDDYYCTPEGDHCCEPCLLRAAGLPLVTLDGAE